MTLAPDVERKAADPVPANPAIDKRAKKLLEEAAGWGEQLAAVWVRLLKREQKVVVAKLSGSKAREGTKFWDPTPPPHETKEFKVGKFIDTARWLGELEDELTPIYNRLFSSYLDRGAALFEEKGKRGRMQDRKRLAELTAARIAEARDYHQAWLERLTEMADRLAAQPNSTIDGLVEQIEIRYSHAEDEVDAVAHSQAVGATNEAQLTVVRSLGMKGRKVWWTAQDPRVRDAHKLAHGQQRDLDEPFKVAGESMDYPGDRSVDPGLWIGCRCVLIFYPMTATGEPASGLEAAARWVGFQRDLARDILDWTDRLETKGAVLHHVATDKGERRYDLPLHAPIVPHPKLSSLSSLPSSSSRPTIYDALTPRRGGWTTKTRQQTLTAIRQSGGPDGKVLAETLTQFQRTGSITRLRSAIAGHLNGVPNQRARVFIEALRNIEPSRVPPTLHRGMTLQGSPSDVVDRLFHPGTSFDTNISSYSTDRKLAESYTGGRKGYSRVVIELVGDKRALPLENLAPSVVFAQEKEWATAGKFEVLEAKVGKVRLRSWERNRWVDSGNSAEAVLVKVRQVQVL